TETPTEEPTDAETEEPTEEETIEGAYYAVAGQNAEGIYDLPEEITGKATVTFKGAVLQSVDNTLIGINNADLMTTNSYFTNSSVMLLINADGALSYRDGSSTVSSGVNLTVGEEYDFTYEIDVTSATWGVTIADADGNVVFTISDLAFRTTADVLDSIVLVNNNSVDKTAYVRDIVVTVEEEPTDEETEEPTDEETEEPTEETTLPEDAVVSVTGQSEEAIVALEEAITTTGTVEFTLVVDTTQTNDTLVALTNGEAMASNTNYFANAGVQFMISGTTLKARIDGNTEEVGTVESGVEYTFTVSVDVENQTWSAVVTDSEGNQVAVVEETAFRSESALESIDSIVILDNAGGVESAYAYAITVTTESTGGDDEDLSVEVTDYTYTDGGQVIATVGLIDGATEPTDTIVYIVSFTKDGSPLGIVAGEIAVGGTINVSNSDSTGVAAISFVTGITVEDVSPVDGDSDLGTPVGVYYPAE
ncbi:MAG: hypothetical protein LUG52_09225, partial [Clostridia bacterium]|nr:hypothetical protein [Clostridia bacterium]